MNPKETYKNPDWLREKYWDEGMTQREIGELVGVTNGSISYEMRKHGIRTRSPAEHQVPDIDLDPDKTYRNREWLRGKYWDEKLTTQEIADIVGVAQCTIAVNLRKQGIKVRSNSESAKLQVDRDAKINPDQTYRNKGWLKEKYCDEELSLKEISAEIGVSVSTIYHQLKKHCISTRSCSEGICLSIDKRRDSSSEADYRDKNWLKKKYWDERLNQREIAESVGVSPRTIAYWMQKLELEKRERGEAKLLAYQKDKDTIPLYRDKEWLRKQYVQRQRSLTDIAQECEISRGTVANYLKNFGIEIRKPSVYHWNNSWYPYPLRDFIDGLLLGDAHLGQRSQTGRLQISQVKRHDNWLYWLQNQLDTMGIDSSISHRTRTNDWGTSEQTRLCTKAYTEFHDLYNHWYPDGKQVPEDVCISPISCLLWYLGDGYISKQDSPAIEFATQGFSRQGIELLCTKLKSEGFHPRINKGNKGLRIRLRSRDTYEFLNYYIGHPNGIEFNYKFPEISKRYKSRSWLLLQYWKKRLSTNKIAEQTSIQPEHIRRWMKRYNISRRKPREANLLKNTFAKDTYQNKEWLRREYLENKKSAEQIGRELEISSNTIGRWLECLGIPKRTRSEAQLILGGEV